MPPAELGRLARRADTRAVAVIGGVLLIALAVQGLVLYAFVAEESLEQADRRLLQAREAVAALETDGASDAIAAEIAYAAIPGGKRAVRVHTPQGELLKSIGHWPMGSQLIPVAPARSVDRSLDSFRLLGPDRFLIDSVELPSGGRLEIAFPLKAYADDAHEIGRGIGILFVLSSVAAFGVAFFATRHAFAPLREATGVLADTESRVLGSRLRSRGTGDPVDLHAEPVNAVLARVEASFSRLQSFSSDVAHELRTPLNRMRNVTEVALAKADPEEQRVALERVEQSIDELGRMVDALLLLAEVDDRRLPLRPERVDVDAWIRRTAEIWEPAFEERGAKLVVKTDAGTIDADPTLLDRVLSNLLDNAMRHGASGGRVELTAGRDEAGLEIAVDDAGRGVPEAERARVFERFVRLDRTGRGSSGGLGLALARAVARLLGGDLALGRSPLGGARFVWRLPRAGAERVTG